MADITLPRKRVQGETVDERLPDPVVEEILPARHLRHDGGEVVLALAEMFERVAETVAAPEAEYGNDPDVWADRFERLLRDLEFMPNSPTLMNAGTHRDQLAACFVINPDDDFECVLEANGVDADEVRSIAEQQVTTGEFEGVESLPVPEALVAPFVTAHEVTPDAHVRIQAAFQEGVDGSVSKTINLPQSATRADVGETLHLAADLDCKGLTVYRAGSREEQAFEVDNTTEESDGVEESDGAEESDRADETDETNTADKSADDPDPQDGLYGGL